MRSGTPLKPVTRAGFDGSEISITSKPEVEYDEYGRPTGSDTECRDTNPGTFHVIISNYLGLEKQSFVEDRTFDDEVWNQPMRAYRVLDSVEVDLDANASVRSLHLAGQNSAGLEPSAGFNA